MKNKQAHSSGSTTFPMQAILSHDFLQTHPLCRRAASCRRATVSCGRNDAYSFIPSAFDQKTLCTVMNNRFVREASARFAHPSIAALGLSAVLSLAGCGTVADYWDENQTAVNSEAAPGPAERTDWFAAQGFALETPTEGTESTQEAPASMSAAKDAKTAEPVVRQESPRETTDLTKNEPQTKPETTGMKAISGATPSKQNAEPNPAAAASDGRSGWRYDAFAAETARAQAKADSSADGAAAAKEVFYGEWVEPVPGRANRIQGYRFNPDGTAASIGAMALKAKRWDVKGTILTIWGDDENAGFTIPFEVQFLVLQANDHLLHIREGGGPEMILQKRSR